MVAVTEPQEQGESGATRKTRVGGSSGGARRQPVRPGKRRLRRSGSYNERLKSRDGWRRKMDGPFRKIWRIDPYRCRHRRNHFMTEKELRRRLLQFSGLEATIPAGYNRCNRTPINATVRIVVDNEER